MLEAVIIQRGASTEVVIAANDGTSESHAEVEPRDGPNPIVPEIKELAWGGGAFLVFLVLMRLVLYPRLKTSMDARYASIRSSHEQADATRAAARAEVAEYQSKLAVVKAEANERIDAARGTLETERAERMEALNADIAERRRVAQARVQAARDGIEADIETAVASVVSRAIEHATGRVPEPAVVTAAVKASMDEGVSR